MDKTEPLNASDPCLDFLFNPSLQFVVTFNANDSRILHSRYYL